MWKMKNFYLTTLIFFQVHENIVSSDYTKPVTNFKQLINRDNYGNPYKRNYIVNNENTIQLSWDYVHFYHDYKLEWWTNDIDFTYHEHTIDYIELAETRFKDVEYYSFVHNQPGVYVYYFQIRGWLYGRGYGMKSNILKCLKPYKGQPFPLNGLIQLPNQTSSIHIKWQIPNKNHTIDHYKIIYCPLRKCTDSTTKEGVTSTNEFFINFDTNPQPLARYKVSVYGVTNDVIKDKLSQRQAKNVIARPWLVGQPTELQHILQMRSRYSNSLTLCYEKNPSIWKFKTTTNVAVFLNESKIDCNYEVHSNKVYVPSLIHRSFVEITNLPISNAVYGVEVYESNTFGDGYRKRLMISPNSSIMIGLPKKVQELTPWTSGELQNAITVRWRTLAQLEAGYLTLEGYVITYSEAGSSVERSETYQTFPRYEKYLTFTIRSVQPNNTYTLSVCGYNRYGRGLKSVLYDLNSAMKINVIPKRIRKIYQEPNINKRQVTFSWYTEKDEESILQIIDHRITLKRRGCINQVATVPAHSFNNTATITIQCRLKDDNIRQFLEIAVTIAARNSYALGRPSFPFDLTTGFIGLPMPSDLRLISCRNKVILSWPDIREKKKGYCISHQSLKDYIWNPCCMKYPALEMMEGEEDDEYAPKLRRNSDGYLTFEQKLMPHKTFTNILGSCQIPVYGTVKFKVSAFNELGTGYSATTGYSECDNTPKYVNSSAKNKFTVTIILVCVVSLVLIVIGALVWRFKRVRGSLRHVFNSVNSQAAEATNEHEMVSLAPQKLPTYEEAILDTPTGPPPTFEEAMSLTGDITT